MKSNKRYRAGAFTVFCAVLIVVSGMATFARSRAAASLFSVAAPRPLVKVTLNGAVIRDGNEVPLAKAGSVTPGEVLHWVITSENDGDGAAREYKSVGNIPKGTLLVAGSTVADGAVSVTYSIDEGKSYATQPVIEEKQPDGSVKRVPAPISMYTQVRYEWSDALGAGGKLNASSRVRVK